jgi:TM2 domain-containing membrane protein YozV
MKNQRKKAHQMVVVKKFSCLITVTLIFFWLEIFVIQLAKELIIYSPFATSSDVDHESHLYVL